MIAFPALARAVLTEYGFHLVCKTPSIFIKERAQAALLLYPTTVLGSTGRAPVIIFAHGPSQPVWRCPGQKWRARAAGPAAT
ncbi:hypothetical protein WJX81_004227 [Elliptochloris bilobata]|uniref:Uncharacterized protein n=1 Tax=Elliptochloris bilobata TaxID=381761 RepID=A0AAW1QVC3_9CHLO